MVTVGEQVWAVRSDLVMQCVAAATPAVDAAAVAGGTHGDRLQEAEESVGTSSLVRPPATTTILIPVVTSAFPLFRAKGGG
ncbi:hypothetical protein SF23_02340 [Streptomyces sp. MBRL 10]|nr:hypothetical protein SF23_02340 [Streptomyces sp. MBRL 10]